ncbi:hypothetical protein L2E82_14574 [Cichorium intybus]|uniref:Uncharacterized protein n=1 Tax=Cichorium intybus TaxID=13427 RepID=A0ACB9F0Z6_CICIN|nr:hypothetical protein L2E82_14574 [Cichorium intybus]
MHLGEDGGDKRSDREVEVVMLNGEEENKSGFIQEFDQKVCLEDYNLNFSLQAGSLCGVAGAGNGRWQ